MKKIISLSISVLLIVMSFAFSTSAFAAANYTDEQILKNRDDVKTFVVENGQADGTGFLYKDPSETFTVKYEPAPANTLAFSEVNEYEGFTQEIKFTLNLSPTQDPFDTAYVEETVDIFSHIKLTDGTGEETKKTTVNMKEFTKDTELAFTDGNDTFDDNDHADCVKDCMETADSDSTNNLEAHLNMLGFLNYETTHVYDEAAPDSATPATTTSDGVAQYTCTVCHEIVTKKIAKIAKIVVNPEEYKYDGKQKTPEVTVYDADGNIVNPDFYTVKYPEKRTEIGTYEVTVEFSNLYKGTEKATFKIVGDKTTNKNKSNNSPKTGAISMGGLGMVAAGAAILTLLKKKEEE